MSRKAKRKKKNQRKNALYLIFVGACAFLIALFALLSSGGRNASTAPSVSEPTAAVQKAQVPVVTSTPSQAPTAEPTPTPEPLATPVSITITAAGDVTLGGDSRQGTLSAFDKAWKANEPDYFLKNLLPIFGEDDLTVVNLEGPLTDATKSANKQFVFKGRPEYAQILSAGSVEITNLANNHSEDFKKQGLADTKEALDAEGIAHFGFDETYIATVKGVKIGFCGYRTMTMKSSAVKKTIEALAEECDIVIVSFHWGTELKYTPDANDIKLGKNAIDAGADLVIGHHTHVVGPVEEYKGKYIVYSTGNCCFGGSRSPTDPDSLLFQQTFVVDDGEVSDGGIKVIPIRISSSQKSNNYQPILLEGDDAKRVFGKIEKSGKGLDNAVAVWE